MEEDREAVFVSELSLPALYSHSSSSSSSEEFSFDVDTIKETGKSENTKETPPLFQEDAGRNDGFSSSSSDDSLVTKKNPIQMIKRKERRPVSRKRPAPSESIFDSDEFDVLHKPEQKGGVASAEKPAAAHAMEESQPIRSSASSQPANRSQQLDDQQISPSRVSLDTSSIPLASSPTECSHGQKRLSSPTSNSLRDGKQLLSPGDDSIQDGKQPFSPTANSLQSDKQPASPAASSPRKETFSPPANPLRDGKEPPSPTSSSPRKETFSPPANSLQDDNQPPFPTDTSPTECSVNEVHLVEDSIAIEPAAPPHGDAEDAVTEFGTIFLYDKIVEEASVHDPSLVSAYKCDCQLVGHNQCVPLRALYAETPAIRGGASLEAENLFIAGLLVLPARETKVMENCGNNCLVMVMLEGEDAKVRVDINANQFFVSRTDVFWVPKQNEYSIVNLSSGQDAKFVFVNIRSDM
ncbi:hypothetical protein BLSTO_02769 [Blastocystis sp. subtype 1]